MHSVRVRVHSVSVPGVVVPSMRRVYVHRAGLPSVGLPVGVHKILVIDFSSEAKKNISMPVQEKCANMPVNGTFSLV